MPAVTPAPRLPARPLGRRVAPSVGAAPRSGPLWLRLALLVALLAAAIGVYSLAIVPWMNRWGATPDELTRALPGDELVPNPVAQTTRAVTIQATPADIWPWLVQLGQGRGGLYSYEALENLVGCDLHNADRVHPEWQDLKVGDIVRFMPDGYLGLPETPRFTVKAVEPNRLLSLYPWVNFVLEPVGPHTTRLILRERIPADGFDAGPFEFIMARRLALGVQERAEGRPVPSLYDTLEVFTWVIAGLVALVGAVWTLRARDWRPSFGLTALALAAFLTVLFGRPPLWQSVAGMGGLLVCAVSVYWANHSNGETS